MFLGFIKFIAAFFAVFSTFILIIQIINSVINPQLTVENNVVVDKNNNSRLMFSLIASISWALVIALI